MFYIYSFLPFDKIKKCLAIDASFKDLCEIEKHCQVYSFFENEEDYRDALLKFEHLIPTKLRFKRLFKKGDKTLQMLDNSFDFIVYFKGQKDFDRYLKKGGKKYIL